MLSGENEKGRLLFLYSMFDVNLEGKIDREDLRGILFMFLEAMLNVTYENSSMNEMKNKIREFHEKMIE
jgi:Ca2+-binding EF-hand superfamily protein